MTATKMRLLIATTVLLLAAGCVPRADFEHVRREQAEMRAQLADAQVAVDSLRRQLDSVRANVEDRGGRGPGAAAAADLQRRIGDLESRIANLEGRTPPSGETPPPPPPGAQPP